MLRNSRVSRFILAPPTLAPVQEKSKQSAAVWVRVANNTVCHVAQFTHQSLHSGTTHTRACAGKKQAKCSRVGMSGT